jgi:3-hydroxyisobutyrate dehydrogenase-like beta-hydroxyacid dehydrogenase
VGVIGLGAMGRPIAEALAVHVPVVVHDVREQARSAARSAGLSVAGSPAELAVTCSTVLLSLPGPSQVSEVLVELVDGGTALLVLDTSTIGPDSVRSNAELAARAGTTYLDTPILGRPDLVGGWTIPVGGPVAAYEVAERVLAPLARRVVHVGDVGAAATVKVANNLMFSVINAVTAEALLLARAAGVDPGLFVDTVLDSGAATVSGLFRSIAPRAVAGDFTPTFSLDLVRKDNDLAVQLARSLGLDLPVGSAARDLHDRAVAAGHGAEDSVAVLRVLEEEAGLEARRG